MKIYAPKKIDLDTVMNNYLSIIESQRLLDDNETPNFKDLKEISPNMASLILLLGKDGLYFLSDVMKGEFNLLSENTIYEAYTMCNGFGEKTKEELAQINDGWDWSHVRDSSIDAIKKAEYFLKEKLIDLYNKN